MTLRKIDQASADIDDASTTVEELQAEPDVATSEKLKEVHEKLAHASDALDEVDEDGKDDKDDGKDEDDEDDEDDGKDGDNEDDEGTDN